MTREEYMNGLELYHHGILGQKWGIRRFQNKDGLLTRLGKARKEAQTKKLMKKKREAISKGDVDYAKKHSDKFTTKELQKLMDKHDMTTKLNDDRVEEKVKKATEWFKKAADLTNNVSNFSANSIKIWNDVAKISNTFLDTDLKIIKETKDNKNSGNDNKSSKSNKNNSNTQVKNNMQYDPKKDMMREEKQKITTDSNGDRKVETEVSYRYLTKEEREQFKK